MPNPSISKVVDFFRQPHLLASGSPEPVTARAPPSGMPPGPPIPLPPILEGIYRTIAPTPAETGELPQRYWPQQPPTGQNIANSLYPPQG